MTSRTRERAARERMERIEQALAEREELHKKREARMIKMADGGDQPAYNVQFATTSGTQIIVGVEVTNQGSDAGQLQPMLERIEQQHQQRLAEVLVDGGFNSRADITRVEADGTRVFTPLKQEQELIATGKDPDAPQPADTDEYFAFRQRMQTGEAKAIYQQRAATAEFPNAGCRNRELTQFPVRSRLKARSIALWQALAHNFQMLRHHG